MIFTQVQLYLSLFFASHACPRCCPKQTNHAMLSQKTKNNFEKTNALKEKSSTKNENKQKNGEEFMQNQAKKTAI